MSSWSIRLKIVEGTPEKTKCTLYCVIKTQIGKMKCNKNTRKISAVVRICLLHPYWRNMEKRKMKQTFKKQDKIFVQQPKHKGPPQSTRCKPLRSKWTVEEHHDQQDWKIIGEHLENWKPSSFIKKTCHKQCGENTWKVAGAAIGKDICMLVDSPSHACLLRSSNTQCIHLHESAGTRWLRKSRGKKQSCSPQVVSRNRHHQAFIRYWDVVSRRGGWISWISPICLISWCVPSLPTGVPWL